MKKKLVVFSGAGLSAESGINTFRDAQGMWEQHNVMDVASISGWRKNRQLVIDFYNQRRKHLSTVVPNSAHLDLAALEDKFDVIHVTQNVDDLLERAGCTNILHLHGELVKMREFYSGKIFDWAEDFELTINSRSVNDELLRPHIVWFGEAVPNIEKAVKLVESADIFVVIGSSLQVYPAANLLAHVDADIPIYIIDPNGIDSGDANVTHIKDVATNGIKKLIELLND